MTAKANRLVRWLRRKWAPDAPRLRQRIGFVPPGKEPEMVPLDEGSGLDEVGGGMLAQFDEDT